MSLGIVNVIELSEQAIETTYKNMLNSSILFSSPILMFYANYAISVFPRGSFLWCVLQVGLVRSPF